MLITVAHHLLTDAQPDPKQYSAAPGHLTPIYTLGVAFYGMEYPFAQLDQLSWLCSLPVSCAPPHRQSMGKVLKSPLIRVNTT